jgi:FKBP-type peptidyl-prolyl cis-trans isomerase FklB
MSLFDKLNQAKDDKLSANLKAGEDFLEENKKREVVHTTASGLQYEVLTEGSGPKPKATDKVKCHYHGTLIEGTIFDSSVQRGQPATFPLNMVIKGWTEALQLMPVGSKYRLFLHPSLAYGERQTGAVIGPNSTLIFDVELLGID